MSYLKYKLCNINSCFLPFTPPTWMVYKTHFIKDAFLYIPSSKKVEFYHMLMRIHSDFPELRVACHLLGNIAEEEYLTEKRFLEKDRRRCFEIYQQDVKTNPELELIQDHSKDILLNSQKSEEEVAVCKGCGGEFDTDELVNGQCDYCRVYYE